ncbi:hypothetical protein GO755_38140 [Spirosoma sp. HMF4905]|uniref:Tetratricopeptide repeat protein n=1 Tax=Spirosoma arboris TaxID=2682092 RepID=A0A7K1SQ46_9BACT|nr:hypothetical protein [Spirosoma arboris]MVM35897.1 hypothetical protein [Spirosoma arboris]
MKNYAYILLLIVAPLLAPAQSAEHILDSLQRELGKAKADTARMWLLYELAKYQSFQTPDSAFWYTRQGLQLARKTNHQKGEMEGKGWLAYLFAERDIPKSMRLRLEVLQQAQQANDRVHISFTYVQLGILQIYLENYRQAIVYYKRAKTLAVEDNDKQNQAGLSTELGGAYWLLHQPDSARYYLTLAAKEDPAIKQFSVYLNYLGRLEGDYNPTKANAYFRQSIQMAKAQQFLRGLGYVYRWYSEFLWKQNQPDSSILMAKAGLQAGQTVANFRNIL